MKKWPLEARGKRVAKNPGETTGGCCKCGKERTCGNGFWDLWQIKGLQEKSRKCGKEKS